MGLIPVATLNGMIRQGRLFRSDQVSKDGGRPQSLGSYREFAVVFDEVNPAQLSRDSLRSAPEFAGEADQLSLARAFVRIYRGRHNGRLFVCGRDHEEKVVIFRDGVPVNATSNIKDEWLGQVLRNQGLIDQATFDEAVRSTQTDGPRLGEVLVESNKISARQLYRALAVQAMDRLLKLFQRGGTFHFVLDESAAEEEILLLAGPRDVLETCLSASLPPQKVTAILAESGDPALRVEVPEDLADDLNDGDRTVLTILEDQRPLSQMLPRIAEALRLTTAEARARVLFLMIFDCVHVGNPEMEALESRLAALQSRNFFDMLDIRRGSTAAEVEQAHREQLAKLAELDEGRGSRAAGQIRNLLDRAREVLLDPDRRPLYERALQLGVDFDQPEAQTRLRHEMLLERGRGLIGQQAYADAAQALDEAARLVPDDPETETEAGLAHYLAADRGSRAAKDAKRRVERAIQLAPAEARAHLVLGRIERLEGNKEAAEAALRRALQINPNEPEVDAELQALQGRRTKARGGNAGGGAVAVQRGAYLAAAAALLVTGLLYVGANLVPGGAELWPDVDQRNLQVTAGYDPLIGEMQRGVTLRLNFSSEKLSEAALRLGAKPGTVDDKNGAITHLLQEDFDEVITILRSLRQIPEAQRVMGSIEYYYAPEDAFWWLRRVLLIILGLVFIARIGREKIGAVPWLGDRSLWLLAAPVYGIAVGFLSNTILVAASPGVALGMTVFHVLAEQIFFVWFVSRLMVDGVSGPLWAKGLACTAAGLLFGVYHLSYFATLQLPPVDILIQLLQISVFAGAAYAVLAWRSGGVLAPLVAHLMVNGTMMVRTILA